MIDSTLATASSLGSPTTDIEATSGPFVGRWHRLVSTTNWEKGRIISAWREALVDSMAAVSEYSDEAWSRLVGAVTGQHVGRLRRVYERFGQSHENFVGLYWSHFQAALDWDDAEMWLEGAVQNKWSVAEVRRQRWETLHPGEGTSPAEPELASEELDADYQPADGSPQDRDAVTPRLSSVSEGSFIEGPDFGDEGPTSFDGEIAAGRDEEVEDAATVQPFVNLATLPEDVAEVFESFKLAILRHKADRWQAVSCSDVLAALDSLKQLAVAP